MDDNKKIGIFKEIFSKKQKVNSQKETQLITKDSFV